MSSLRYNLIVVSPEKEIYTGLVIKVLVTAVEGELGIYPNHAPLLTFIKPGMIYITKENSLQNNIEHKIIYLSGGILEVQLNSVIVLADVAIHAEDLNEQEILLAKSKTEDYIKNSSNNINYAKASLELAKELAKLRVITLMKSDIFNNI
uniref:ATP synthase epsilon chain n=1 Tax=Candidatus Aschnera chinzeii TaxID=1485666 RepID=A0AAT9G466_9ENTR|nr:MAG: F0F1 ATP synthase subunit epsilon [Candidatus Aschnera chinzeii]